MNTLTSNHTEMVTSEIVPNFWMSFSRCTKYVLETKWEIVFMHTQISQDSCGLYPACTYDSFFLIRCSRKKPIDCLSFCVLRKCLAQVRANTTISRDSLTRLYAEFAVIPRGVREPVIPHLAGADRASVDRMVMSNPGCEILTVNLLPAGKGTCFRNRQLVTEHTSQLYTHTRIG